MSIVSVDNIQPIGSGTSVTVNSAATLVLNNVNSTGVVTATSFVGSGANLTSLPAQATIANNADNRVITGGSGVNLNGEANLTFNGNSLLVNNTSSNTAAHFKGAGGAGFIQITDSGDSSTAFIGVDGGTLKFQTSGSSYSDKLIITSDGKVAIGTATPASNSAAYMLTVADPSNGGGNCGITIRSGNTSGTINQGSIFYSDATSGAGEYAGYLQYSHSTSPEWFRIGVGANPRFYVYSDGNAEITDGDLKLASGHGIDFSATSNSSGANISELLDDYEEGSWTPTWNFTTSNYGPNYTHQMGAYTKIGRQVTVYFSLYSTSVNGSTGGLRVAGLPFTDSTSPVSYPATAGAFPIFGFNGWTGEYIAMQVVSGKIELYGVQKNNTSYAPIMNNQVNGGGALYLKGQVTYNV